MNYECFKPCTICGNLSNNRYLFSKSIQDNGTSSIRLFCCSNCSTVFLGDYSEFFESQLYDYYLTMHGKSKTEIYSAFTKKSYLKVLDLLSSIGCGSRILDVGCGNGSFVDAAIERGYEAKGIDLSSSAVVLAQSLCLPVERLDFLSNEIKHSTYDAVTMFEVIEHLPKPLSFFHKASEVLSPGGLMYLTTPNFNALDRWILGKAWNVFHPEHLTYFTPFTLKQAIGASNNLEVISIKTKNLSNDLIIYFKEITNFSRINPINMITNENAEPNYNSQEIFGRSKILSCVKHVVNFLLNMFGVGSTIVVIVRRSV